MWYVVIGLPRGARSLAPASINQRLSADVQNFANTPGLIEYTFDAGMIPNGVVSDFEETMRTCVEFGQPVTDLAVTGDSGASYPTAPAAIYRSLARRRRWLSAWPVCCCAETGERELFDRCGPF